MSASRALLLLSVLLAASAAVADPQLVTDIRPDGVQSSLPRNFASDGTTAYFVADDQNPSALWKTDGTAEGTRLLKMTMPPHIESFAYSNPWLTVSGPTLYFFAASDLGINIDLWRSDGSDEGTTSIATIGDRFNNEVGSVAAVGPGRLAFTAVHGPAKLWISDGTKSGTHVVTGPADPSVLVGDGTVAYFTAGPSTARTIWRTDGTDAGTRSIAPMASPAFLAAVIGGKLLLVTQSGSGTDLSLLDGAAATTIVHLDATSFTSVLRGPDRVLFTVTSEATGRQLWITDGTAGGTKALVPVSAALIGAGTVGDLSFFTATPQSGARQLWRTDGTPAGTFVVTDDPGAVQPIASGRRLQYFMKTSAAGRGLWVTDGTVAGTQRISAILPRFDVTSPSVILNDDTLLFGGNDAVQTELWRSDGTADSTRLLKNIADDTSSLPTDFAALGNTLLFRAFDTAHGYELWRTDGTTAGTALVADLRPGTGSSSPEALATFGSVVLFIADDGVHGRELWRTDGTAAGTRQVAEINATGNGFGFASIDYRPRLLVSNGVAYFRATSGGTTGLWRSDGTAEGTFALKAGGSDPVVYGSAVFFDSTTGLWRTDGTVAGTTQVTMTPFNRPFVAGSKLFLLSGGLSVLDSPAATPRLLKSGSNGAPEGAFGIALNGLFLFTIGDGVAAAELWRSDGTVEGTRLLRDIYPGTRGGIVTGISFQPFAVLGSNLYFTANDGVHGAELWSTDGTEAGTRMVADLAPGATDSWPDDFAVSGGRLWFSAFDVDHGRELWSLTGTELTRYDISRGPASSGAGGMFPFAGAMWFHASTPATGSELWKIETTAPPRRRAAGIR